MQQNLLANLAYDRMLSRWALSCKLSCAMKNSVRASWNSCFSRHATHWFSFLFIPSSTLFLIICSSFQGWDIGYDASFASLPVVLQFDVADVRHRGDFRRQNGAQRRFQDLHGLHVFAQWKVSFTLRHTGFIIHVLSGNWVSLLRFRWASCP